MRRPCSPFVLSGRPDPDMRRLGRPLKKLILSMKKIFFEQFQPQWNTICRYSGIIHSLNSLYYEKNSFYRRSCGICFCRERCSPQKVDFGKLPKNSQEFIQKNFPGEKVKAVEMDREASWDKYTVYFNSGNQVSFEGGSGDCSQIIMKNGSVPMSVIPAKIKTYAGNNYAGQRIVMMETTADGYKVALADKTVLDFDKDGNFTKATK